MTNCGIFKVICAGGSENNKIIIAPSKGFTVYRGDAARLENGKITVIM